MSVLATLRHMTGMTLTRNAVELALRQRMEQTGHATRKAYLQALGEQELRELVELVVVPESWLFRDPRAFEVAAEFTRKRIAEGARMVRIMSIPCAGGEEPYSMAMALCDAGVAPQAFSIDAYDISAGCIARAQHGVYGRNAFRSRDLGFRERYFTPLDDDMYRIGDALRERIRFRQGNILLDELGGPRHYDIIFCRNLLIYFDDPTTTRAIARLSERLTDDGILMAGYAEVPSFVRNGFSPLPHRQAFALRKALHLPPVPAKPALPAAPRAPLRSGRPAASAPAAAPVAKPRTAARPPAGKPAAPPAPAALDLAAARALADAGKTAQAEAACLAWLAQHPESADAYCILGLLAESARQSDEAERHFRRCLYLQPDHYEALCHLALLQEQAGNSDAAATLKQRAARAFQRQQAR